MRGLPKRRIASTALCAALVLGAAAPAVAAEHASPGERAGTAAEAPVPGADALLAQTRSLSDITGVLTPVTELLGTALNADNGQLTPDQATRLAEVAASAIAEAGSTSPAATLPAPAPASAPRKAPADLKDDALAALRKAVDGLITATTSGDAGKIVPASNGVVTGIVNVLASVLLGGALPAPDLAGLPSLPSLPATAPSLPAAPSVPAAPSLPAAPNLPVSAPAAPAAPAAAPAAPNLPAS
ncbi:hypothetical protein ABZX40_32260 [Streptomyces sp. NPDC004610]|uniref:hypothetical protein n=1 Tax=unclassified Streptomyces TaxID=2593676 RepID=UPI0033B87603